VTGWDALSLAFSLGWALQGVRDAVPVRIEFEAPANCSSAEAFYTGVRARTDRVRTAAGSEPAMSLRVQLSVRGRKVQGKLAARDEAGVAQTRAVEGTTCDEVVEALSLTAALAIDPKARFTAARTNEGRPSEGSNGAPSTAGATSSAGDRSGDAPPSRDKTASNPAPAADPAEGSDTERAADASRDSAESVAPFRFEAGAQLAAATLLRTELSVGPALFARLSQTGTGLRPSLGVVVMHLRNDILASDIAADVRWTGVVLSACPFRFGVSSAVGVRACGFANGGWLSATGREVSAPATRARSWWSAGALLRGEGDIGPHMKVEAELGLGAPLVRRRFVVTEPERFVGETPDLAPFGAVGLGYRF